MQIAISVRQPWAWLIIRPDLTDPEQRRQAAEQGLIKDIENRNWQTKQRGRVWIHASKTLDMVDYANTQIDLKNWWEWGDLPDYIQLPLSSNLDLGGIIGSVEIVDCVTESDSPWFFGDYGFKLANAKPHPFTPCRGQLNFFQPKRPEVVQ